MTTTLALFGNKVLRSAIQQNLVSFPAQPPALAKHPLGDVQGRISQLYFVAGWTVRDIGKRYGMSGEMVRKSLTEWRVRAISSGYIQEIGPDVLPALAESDLEDDAGETLLYGRGPVGRGLVSDGLVSDGLVSGAGISDGAGSNGAQSGGVVSGGSANGGAVSGGSANGDEVSCFAASGGAVSGGSANGDAVSCFAANGDAVSGGSANGDEVSCFATNGGVVSGGAVGSDEVSCGSVVDASLTPAPAVGAEARTPLQVVTKFAPRLQTLYMVLDEIEAGVARCPAWPAFCVRLLGILRQECVQAGFSLSMAQLDRMEETLEAGREGAADLLRDLRNRIADEERCAPMSLPLRSSRVALFQALAREIEMTAQLEGNLWRAEGGGCPSHCRRFVAAIQQGCVELGLGFSLAQVKRIETAIHHDPQPLSDLLRDLRHRLTDEEEQLALVHVPHHPARKKFAGNYR